MGMAKLLKGGILVQGGYFPKIFPSGEPESVQISTGNSILAL